MPGDLQIRGSLTLGQEHAVKEAAATLPKAWALIAEDDVLRAAGDFRLTVHGPTFTTSRLFEAKTTPLVLMAYVKAVRRDHLQ
jgi:hypothetical protein